MSSLDFHPFLMLRLNSLPENPWRLFVNHLHWRCHRRALLEVVLIIGVRNGYVKTYWIPNSCLRSFYCVDFVLASFQLSVSLSHLDHSSVIIISPLASLTSSISASSILAVYFWTAKQTYDQWLVHDEFSHSKAYGQWLVYGSFEASRFTIDSVSWLSPIHNYPQLLQNYLDSLLTTLLGSTSLSLSMPLLTPLILGRIVHNCSELLYDSYRF